MIAIAIDTSSLRRYATRVRGADTEAVREGVASRRAVIPPVVIAEAYSDPNLDDYTREMLEVLPRLLLLDGYWERTGLLRAAVLAKGFKAALPDCLVAQSCIDHDIPLITHDHDFRHFTAAGLQLR